MSAQPTPAGYTMPYGAYAQPMMGTMPVGTMPMGAPMGYDGGIERMVVPGETQYINEPMQVQSFTTVAENQTYMEPQQVPIKVPRVVMEDVEVSYQVPAYETRTHTAQRPRTVMEEQTITVQEPRMTTEQVPVQVPHVQTYQVAQQHHKIVEYQRPQMVQGRYLRTYAGPAQTVGTVAAPTPYTQPMATTGYTQPMATTGYTQPMPTTMPYGYGSVMAPAYAGIPTISQAAPSNYQAPADDAISA
eukprot:CAMPEP_0172007572 /NCGR_PEP_ID=MMETSP1041-20130122/6185_1 /TAXON_ID=464988 /ORGANISM="Hemiselmis andersenii, Strain CCMP439" /LENGTH=244 /DNA_ID=CAMNT_0012661709 /DNA_START=18 /DNA_END=752 /DNA_ORIENTATION=+